LRENTLWSSGKRAMSHPPEHAAESVAIGSHPPDDLTLTWVSSMGIVVGLFLAFPIFAAIWWVAMREFHWPFRISFWCAFGSLPLAIGIVAGCTKRFRFHFRRQARAVEIEAIWFFFFVKTTTLPFQKIQNMQIVALSEGGYELVMRATDGRRWTLSGASRKKLAKLGDRLEAATGMTTGGGVLWS
jgi:membrane protein YdbS with pleckstrin-like domain